jgi:hypothetical protein
LSLNTSRLFDASERKGIDTVATWAKGKIGKISTPHAGGFLQSFARAVELDEVLSAAKPLAVLVESSTLHELLIEEGASTPFWIKSGTRKELSGRAYLRMLRELEKVFEVEADGFFEGLKGKVKRNKRSLSVWFDGLRRIHIEIGGKESTLQAFLLKNDLYSICFTDPKYMYFMGQCFEDVSGISEIEGLLEVLEPVPTLNGCISEKGEPIPAVRTRFDPDCVFDRVERLFSTDDLIYCDDIGVEWADHICLNEAEGRIAFVHSKHGDVSTSASNLRSRRSRHQESWQPFFRP